MATQINVRIDEKLKKETEAIFDKLGISMADAFRIFLKKVKMEKGIPFDMKVSDEIHWDDLNEETKEALSKKPTKNNTILIRSVEQYKKLKESGELEKYDFVEYENTKLSFECMGIKI